jgi:hypothetical protein
LTRENAARADLGCRSVRDERDLAACPEQAERQLQPRLAGANDGKPSHALGGNLREVTIGLVGLHEPLEVVARIVEPVDEALSYLLMLVPGH